ncbi:MAG TPA: AlwI family type II restriction endonuclease [Candidatus Deferrimicrobium sp.]|nr:AlwI family type II restriction endonuclease [Candidatus Deferrimicrobium sp.]
MAGFLWHIGNTTVRTPYRLKEALQVLKNSEFHGNLLGTEREEGFAKLLHEKEILNASRINQEETATGTGDLGRKWRSALGQLGFVAMHLTRGLNQPIDPQIKQFITLTKFPGLSGMPYEITPNGHRLIQAESTAEQQECFLRALAAYKIPSIFEERYDCSPFSPLRFVLQILLALEKNGAEAVIGFDEMALFVQRRTPDDGLEKVVAEILTSREARNKSGNKKKFDANRLLEAGEGKEEKAGTLKDYADLNFRYLKATGLFQARGRGIILMPEKHTLCELLVAEVEQIYNKANYVNTLWSGARLPTDDKIKAIEVIHNLSGQLEKYGEKLEIRDITGQSVEELSQYRYRLEERLRRQKERVFATEQAGHWQDIAESMNAFKGSRGKIVLPNGEMGSIPGGEAPAYFEWIIWRAFLAIDSLTNMPWEARKFKIDQDFLPLSHAPAGGPDMVFEFEEFVLVVEVTLSSSSRQEAVEGEPVRRHVAEIAETFENTDKKVYCLFISINIDSNTAETFKIGNWYKKDNTRLPLQIVPVTLDDFSELFSAGFKTGRPDPMKIRQFLLECRAMSNKDAPEWKKAIHNEVKKIAARL